VNGAVPKHPIIFSKVPETVVANGAPIIIDPSVSIAIDYERSWRSSSANRAAA
jgi:2-keto-4-pentenoate hydratase/2-oxohepta-3-ene-1,7-dioic acid hydratase in catechol pathway